MLFRVWSLQSVVEVLGHTSTLCVRTGRSMQLRLWAGSRCEKAHASASFVSARLVQALAVWMFPNLFGVP